MHHESTDEQDDLRSTVRDFFAAQAPLSKVHDVADGRAAPHDPALWKRLATELGVIGLAVPEEHGGGGFGLIEQQLVLEESGRALFTGPLLSAVTTLEAILAVDPGGRDGGAHLRSICSGEVVPAFAATDRDGRLGRNVSPTTATEYSSGWRLDGVKSFVVDGSVADLLVASAETAAGPALFAIYGDAAGLQRRRLSTMDPTRDLAEISFDSTPAQLLGSPDRAAVRRAVDLAVLALAAEQVGGAAACLDMTVAYVKEREQFGRPVGSFQAVKHRLADVHVGCESARSMVVAATATAQERRPQLGADAAVAGAFCSWTFTDAAAAAIQLHGGIGFTWEHDAHLYLKRATCSKQILGTPAEHRARLFAIAWKKA